MGTSRIGRPSLGTILGAIGAAAGCMALVVSLSNSVLSFGWCGARDRSPFGPSRLVRVLLVSQLARVRSSTSASLGFYGGAAMNRFRFQ